MKAKLALEIPLAAMVRIELVMSLSEAEDLARQAEKGLSYQRPLQDVLHVIGVAAKNARAGYDAEIST